MKDLLGEVQRHRRLDWQAEQRIEAMHQDRNLAQSREATVRASRMSWTLGGALIGTLATGALRFL